MLKMKDVLIKNEKNIDLTLFGCFYESDRSITFLKYIFIRYNKTIIDPLLV